MARWLARAIVLVGWWALRSVLKELFYPPGGSRELDEW